MPFKDQAGMDQMDDGNAFSAGFFRMQQHQLGWARG
jgi:hypothetical protein